MGKGLGGTPSISPFDELLEHEVAEQAGAHHPQVRCGDSSQAERRRLLAGLNQSQHQRLAISMPGQGHYSNQFKYNCGEATDKYVRRVGDEKGNEECRNIRKSQA